MQKQQIIRHLLEPGVIAIIRSDDSTGITDAMAALVDGGLRAMEITLTTPGALSIIEQAARGSERGMVIGVGTVLDAESCRIAILAGAQFVVTPVMRPEIIAVCNRYSIPIVCGAYTPTEALMAHECGADFIKLFPADTLGPGYVKALLAPLPQLQIIPTGGVDQSTVGDFIRAGCVAVAAGSSLVSKSILQNRNWSQLAERARSMVEEVRSARGGI